MGKTVAVVCRVLYGIDGELDFDDGPLLLLFSDGTSILFSDRRGGEELSVDRASWDGARYNSESEGWRLVCLHDKPEYADIVGQPLEHCRPIVNELDQLAGVWMTLGSRLMGVFAACDECRVEFGEPPHLESLQLRFIDPTEL